MKINKNGKIGMGTANPLNQLHVKDTTSDLYVRLETDKADGRAQIMFENDAQRWQAGINTADAFIIYDDTSGHTVFTIYKDAPVDSVILDHLGNVGIGTNDPDEKLSVDGNIELISVGKIGFNVSDDISSYTVTAPDRDWETLPK